MDFHIDPKRAIIVNSAGCVTQKFLSFLDTHSCPFSTQNVYEINQKSFSFARHFRRFVITVSKEEIPPERKKEVIVLNHKIKIHPRSS